MHSIQMIKLASMMFLKFYIICSLFVLASSAKGMGLGLPLFGIIPIGLNPIGLLLWGARRPRNKNVILWGKFLSGRPPPPQFWNALLSKTKVGFIFHFRT